MSLRGLVPTSSPATRLAILTFSNGRFDARARRIARSAAAAGYNVVIYARWERGLPLEEDDEGLRIVRVPTVLSMAFPFLRGRARRRIAGIRAAASAQPGAGSADQVSGGSLSERLGRAVRDPVPYGRRLARRGYRVIRNTLLAPVARAVSWPFSGLIGPMVMFPLRPLAWAAALEDVAVAADLWHGMWAGSLPGLAALKARHGGRTIYDSRDIYTHARVFDRMRPRLRRWFLRYEQRWAQQADLVVTVNEAYADILGPLLGVARPIVVRNCPATYDPPEGRPDRIRAALGLPAQTAVVLYQGGYLSDRGVEQGMEAILQVPGAHFALIGFGTLRDEYVALAAEARYRDHVSVRPPVPPEELLAWTASADVMLMAIQPTSLNHRYTTPQKLWEAIAAGVPVVASDLPGMAEVVHEVGCGALCDPTDPASIAAAIRGLLALPPEERAAMRSRTLAAARGRYNWDAQAEVLLAGYAKLQAVS